MIIMRKYLIYFKKEKNSNPYYSSNKKLLECSNVVKELLKDDNFIIDRWIGGHRSKIKDDCQVFIHIKENIKVDVNLIQKRLTDLSNKYNCNFTEIEVEYNAGQI